MEIYITDALGKDKYIGTTETCPIPRIGEEIFIGYIPSPKVLSVWYNFLEKLVIIKIDGYIYE